MAQDRTQDRTRVADMQMAEEGMPAGQAPARITPGERQRLTKEQHRETTRQAVLEDVFANKSEFMKFLSAFDVDYDVFEAGLKVFLMKQMKENPDFFDEIDGLSFMSAMFRIAMLGLIPDGKEAAITIFKSSKHGVVATPIIGRDGFVKVYWRTGLIKDINDQVVTRPEYERGWFKYIEGDHGYIEHQVDLERQDNHETMAAYCVINLLNGGTMREVVPKADLEKIAKMSRSPARGSWKFQMDRKAALRRISSKMPKEMQEQLKPLLEVDDLAYDLKAAGSVEGAKRVERNALFSDRPQHRARPRAEPKPLPNAEEKAAEAQREANDRPSAEEAPAGNPDLAQEIVSAIRHATDLPAIAAQRARETEAEDLSDEERDWISETAVSRAQELGLVNQTPREDKPPPAGEKPQLMAIISSAAGEKVYEDADLWRDDILNKMSSISGQPLKRFWASNFAFIEAARPIAGPQVDRIMKVATERGVAHG